MPIRRMILFAVLVSPFVTLSGSDAIFSKDNTHLYLTKWGQCSLIDIDLGKKTCAIVDLTKMLDKPLEGIALSNDGTIFCSSKSALWSYDPSTGSCVKILDAPKDLELMDVSCDPSQNILFAIFRGGQGQQLFCLPKNTDHWIPVYNRRLAPVEYPVFGDDGSLYFSSRGDLWTGFLKGQTEPTLPALNTYSISNKTPDGWPKSIPVAELEAYRFAPVAFLETQNCTPDSTGLHDLAVSRNFVYGNYSRLGGSGWGSLIRCKRRSSTDSKNNVKEMPAGSQADGKQYLPILESVATVANTPCVRLCASWNGELVFYQLKGDEAFLIKDDAKPEALVIPGLNDLL